VPLENLDVSYNNLYNVLPLGLLVVTYTRGNLDLCDMARVYESDGQQTNKLNGVMVLVAVGTFVATMIILIVDSCYFDWRHKSFNEQHKGLLQNYSWHLISFQKVTVKEYELAKFCTI
jgi:hypothetical protein